MSHELTLDEAPQGYENVDRRVEGWTKVLLQPGGRLREQRDFAWRRLNEIPGVDCVKPQGALYVFPRLDPDVYKISDDQQLVIDLLEQQHVLLTHGTGFNLPSPDHIRVVFLAPVETLTEAIGRLGEFLTGYRQ